MSEKSLDTVRLGNSKEQDKSRFQQIQEERINSNFRKLNEANEEVNASITNINNEITEIQQNIDGISSDGNVITVDHPVDIVPRRAYISTKHSP